jgi:universal stress protein A
LNKNSGMSHIQKILVPMDGSPASLAALAQAVTLAEDLGATIDVLHVTAPDEVEVDREMEDAIAVAKNRLGERLESRSVAGDPVQKILDAADARSAHLIVMGTHGRVGRMHALVGSVAESIVRNAPCAVLTVRHPDGAEESFAERIHHRPSIARSSH